MNLEFSQEAITQIDDFANQIVFVFCMPFNESLYSYGINSIENLHYIDRNELNNILTTLSGSYFRTEYLTTHFRKFIYVKDKNEYMELNEEQNPEEMVTLVKKQLDLNVKEVPITNPLLKIMDSLKQKLKK